MGKCGYLDVLLRNLQFLVEKLKDLDSLVALKLDHLTEVLILYDGTIGGCITISTWSRDRMPFSKISSMS